MKIINFIKVATIVPINERIHHLADVNKVNIKCMYVLTTNNEKIKWEHNASIGIKRNLLIGNSM